MSRRPGDLPCSTMVSLVFSTCIKLGLCWNFVDTWLCTIYCFHALTHAVPFYRSEWRRSSQCYTDSFTTLKVPTQFWNTFCLLVDDSIKVVWKSSFCSSFNIFQRLDVNKRLLIVTQQILVYLCSLMFQVNLSWNSCFWITLESISISSDWRNVITILKSCDAIITMSLSHK